MNINSADLLNIAKLKSSNLNSLDKAPSEDKKLREVCNDFESFFMHQILEVSLKNTNVAGDSAGSDIIKGMYTDAISKNSGGSLGISDMLYKFLSEKS